MTPLPDRPAAGPLRLLIVEDNPLHAQALRFGLRQLGYVVLGVAATPDEARRLFGAETPDLLLLDIHLALEPDSFGNASGDGIALAAELLAVHPTPLIFLTSLNDEATFQRARAVAPAAFLLKPFELNSLRRAIELAALRASGVALAEATDEAASAAESAAGDASPAEAVLCLLPDVLFVRHAGRLERVALADVTHLVSDRSYCDVFLATGTRYTLHASLRETEERLPVGRFVRIHRSYVVAWAAIEAVDSVAMEVRVRGGTRLPLGRTYREVLLLALPQLG